jgi:hypothetical protein
MSKRHKCLDLIDAELAKHNTRLVANIFQPNDMFIATERILNLRNGKSPKKVVASHCPVCGKKLIRAKNALSSREK